MPGGDRELRVAAERGDAVGVDAELLGEVEGAAARRELDHVADVVDRLERGAAVVALDSRVMCLSSISWRSRVGIDVDELLAAQDAREVGVVEDALASREAERRAGDHDRLGRRAGRCPRRRAARGR